MYNTRFAPSPTGSLHLGNLRTAIFAWLSAKATGGKFILRIDDTDPERSKQEYVDEMKRCLEWMGLTWDAEYRQSQRFDLYAKVLEDLKTAELARVSVDGSVKLCLMPSQRVNSWTDEIAGEIKISDQDWKHLSDMTIVRRNGAPLYNFVSVIDDFDMGVNYIIRGTDHIPNTGSQVVLGKVIGDYVPKFAHVGLIHALDNKKMSKRDGDKSFTVSKYMNDFVEPEALFNALLRLGWGPKIDDKSTAVLTVDRAIELFVSGGNLRSAPAKFDPTKLASWDRKFKARKGESKLQAENIQSNELTLLRDAVKGMEAISKLSGQQAKTMEDKTNEG